jgi:APA family basic amino acid/polyamine antiporter
MAKLKRVLGLLTLTFYGIGVILGAGIYVLIGEAAAEAGNSVWISFLLAAMIASFTGLNYCELSSMYPKAAPEYTYAKKAFRNPLLSFLVGWLVLFMAIIGASTVALGFGNYIHALAGAPVLLSAMLLIIALSSLNFYGIEESTRLNVIFTLIEISGLIIIILVGASYFGKVNYLDAPLGINGIFSATTIVFFAFLGFEYIATLGEESKNAKKVLPIAIILSILITTLLYVLVAIASVSVVGWKELGKSEAPLALVASKALGNRAFFLLSFIALFATTNTVLANLISGSRVIYGMASQGSLPKFLAFVHEKRKTPFCAIFVVMALSTAFLFIEKIDVLARATGLGALVVFSLVNTSLIKLRFSKPKLARPFRVPLNIHNFPLLTFLGLLFSIILMPKFEFEAISIVLAILASGLFVFYFAKRLRSSRAAQKPKSLKT